MKKLSDFVGKASEENPLELFLINSVTRKFVSIVQVKGSYSLQCIVIHNGQKESVTYDKQTRVEQVETLDCAPTWRSIIDIHAQAYAMGGESAQKEIHRCARMADALNEIISLAKDDETGECNFENGIFLSGEFIKTLLAKIK